MLENLWTLAERQHGLVLRDQALEVINEQRVDRMLAAGRLEVVGTGVYRVPGSPRTPEQQLLTAVRAAGLHTAVASGRSAGWLWGLVDDAPSVPEVMVLAGRYRRMTGVRLVQSVDLTPDECAERRRIPVLKPQLTMLELARVLDREQLADALERGLDLFTMAAMWATLDRYGRSGRNGTARLRDVVANRALEDKPSDATVEERCAQLLRAHHVAGWTFHYVVRDERGRFIAEPDFAFPERRLGIEIDGASKFRQRGYLERFAERRHLVRSLGWDLEHFTWSHVVRRPTYFITTLRHILSARLPQQSEGERADCA